MKNRKIWMIAGGVLAFIVLLILIAPFFINVNRFRPTIESKLQTALGRQVKIGDLSLSLLAGGIAAENISIAEDPAFGSQPFLTAKALQVGVDFLPLLFSSAVHVNSITLHRPEMRMVKGNGGKWNFSSLGAPAAATPARGKTPAKGDPAAESKDFSVGSFRIASGKVVVVSGNRGRPSVYDNVELKARNIGYDSVMPFTLEANTPGGGKLKLDGKAGPLDRNDAAATPLEAKVTVNHLDMATTGFIDPASGLAGVLDYTGTIRSDGKMVRTQGKVKTDKLKLVKGGSAARQPVTIDYATDYDLKRQAGTLTRGDITSGKSTAKLAGTYATQGENKIVHMKFLANNMPVQDVEGLLPAFGVVLPAGSSLQGGTISSNLALEGPIDRLLVTGPIDVSNTRLAGFNLASKMAAFGAHSSGADTIIQTFKSNLKVSPDGIRADNLDLIVPALGAVTGAGTIGADNALNFKMVAKMVHGGGMLGGLSSVTKLGRQQGEIPFLIQGTTHNPIFVPDVNRVLGNSVSSPVKGVGGILGGIFGKKQ